MLELQSFFFISFLSLTVKRHDAETSARGWMFCASLSMFFLFIAAEVPRSLNVLAAYAHGGLGRS